MRTGLLLSAALFVFACGCGTTKLAREPIVRATPSRVLPPSSEPAPQAKPPRESLVRQFEERRDKAQLEAALDRWKHGDMKESETLLLQLIERNSRNVDARRALADLYASKPDAEAALKHLTVLVDQSPEDAQARHSLGLLLESQGRRSEALTHFEHAVRLDPQNELYVLTRDDCREAAADDKVTR